MDSKTRFAKAIDSQFAHLGRAAVYIKSLSEPQDIIVIARRPEQLFELGDGHLHAENPQLEFRVSEVSSPSRGDEIHIDGRIYRIESEPRLDLHQLVWVTDSLPLIE
jgi:hypothetical protein